jgi:hypothetical protein
MLARERRAMAKSTKVTIKVLDGGDDWAVVASVGISTLVSETVKGSVEDAMAVAGCLRAFYVRSRGVDAVEHKIVEPS